VKGRVELVGVVADLSLAELDELRRVSGVDSLQLHGAEPPELLAQLPASDFKAVRIATAADVADARRYRGPRLLVDAKVGDALGGTGHTFDWSLLGTLAEERQLVLAGGLTPENVARAVSSVRPWAIDVASGVERVAPAKDPALLAAFVERARLA
jgi:phosphoribosylanthranilate isomerase